MKLLLRFACALLLVTGTLTQEGFDLSDALGDLDTTTAKPKEQPKTPQKPESGDPETPKPKKPSSGDAGGFDLSDALKPDSDPKPDKPANNPTRSGGGGGSFDDSDLLDVSEGGYKPDGGCSGGCAQDPGSDQQGGADQPQAEAGSGQIAGIVSAIGVALMGAASSYIAYQKKKLCFKLQGGADPESGKGHQGTKSEPQVLSNLLQTN